jgi:hypothetical protein
MSHFRMMSSPMTLAGGMMGGSASGMLVARRRPTLRLQATDPRTLTRTVDVAVVTGCADLHQHPATAAVVEPVGRLLQRSHAPPQGTGQHRGGQGIKGLPNRLSQALRTEGPGSDANQTSRAFVFPITFPTA